MWGRRYQWFAAVLVLVAPFTLAHAARQDAGKPAPPAAAGLRIDPRLIAEAAEVWALIAAPDNPVWPHWNAADTPILIYLPGEQDVLINHPRPPQGFAAYGGPVRFPGGRIMVRNGPTIVEWDGQNTSREIEGVPSLVVADSLSNLRQNVRTVIEDPRPAPEKAKGLEFSTLATDPYRQLAFIVHEAFHVFQHRAAPDKRSNEMLLVYYPVLSVENNVGFAQEGAALAAALRSNGDAALRSALVQWIALRRARRAALPPQVVDYENGTEFLEGLATYTEYRLFQTLEGRAPGPQMWWAQGFQGYGDLSSKRAELVDTMLKHMRGEVPVNNDPYGTAPLRMRLYYSGMAIAAVLDRLLPDWKDRVLQPKVSLTDLAEEAIHASPSDLAAALEAARRTADYDSLVAAKKRLAEEGRARIDAKLDAIEHGAGTSIIVRYGELETPRVGFNFTPFGITVVDENRIIFGQLPIQAHFADGATILQKQPMNLLHDKKDKSVRFRLPRDLSADEWAKAAGTEAAKPGSVGDVKIELPEFVLTAAHATIERDGKDLKITLKPAPK